MTSYIMSHENSRAKLCAGSLERLEQARKLLKEAEELLLTVPVSMASGCSLHVTMAQQTARAARWRVDYVLDAVS